MKRVLPFLLAFLPAVAGAAPEVDHRAIAISLSEQFIVPGYTALAEAAAAQSAAWETFCAAPDRNGFPELEKAFIETADAWSTIEFVRYGPIAENFRFERVAHWPERGRAVNRGLRKLLRGKGDDGLSPEKFVESSVAAQGLTALERLLFDDEDSRPALLEDSPEATRRCAVARTIAASLERLTADVLEEWRRPGGMVDRLREADATLAREAVTRFATDLFSLYETVADRKLAAPAGESIDFVRGTLAEGWRSGRSMQAVILNLEAAEDMTRLMLPEAGTKAEVILNALASARSLAGELPDDLGAAASEPDTRGKLLFLIDYVRSARDLSSRTLPDALGITLGFNSLDGD